jgi:hypothetical protein
MDIYQRIDSKMESGYKFLKKHDSVRCCGEWLQAWEEIKELFAQTGAKDIYEMDKKYQWSEFISNYAQDLEMELHNAGIKDNGYHLKRAIYCEELLHWCGSDELIVSNTKRGMAEGYYEYGDTATGERLYAEWLSDDPDWGWGYIGWSDCYFYDKQYEKAEEVLLNGYVREGLRGKIDVVDRLVTLYGEMEKTDKVNEYKKIFSMLQRTEPKGSFYYKPAPIKAEKIGRNDLCPCGSGKKYKKCCGA